MSQTGPAPRKMEFDKLIAHLEFLEETAPKQKDYEGTSHSKRAHSHKNDKDHGNKKYTIGFTSNMKDGNICSSSSSNKSFNLCRLSRAKKDMRGEPTIRRNVSPTYTLRVR